MKHKEIADVAGKFLAHINLGIIYNNVSVILKNLQLIISLPSGMRFK